MIISLFVWSFWFELCKNMQLHFIISFNLSLKITSCWENFVKTPSWKHSETTCLCFNISVCFSIFHAQVHIRYWNLESGVLIQTSVVFLNDERIKEKTEQFFSFALQNMTLCISYEYMFICVYVQFASFFALVAILN